MKNIQTYIDNTLLKSDATPEMIEKLCKESIEYGFASVCVNPGYVPLAAKLLAGSSVKVCTVIGFPLGQNQTEVKAFEASMAAKYGAEELDMVINVGRLKAGDDEYVKNDIAAVVKAGGGKLVKVIIETFLLTDEEKVRACRLAKEAGADYVKTCTGFMGGGANVHDIADAPDRRPGDGREGLRRRARLRERQGADRRGRDPHRRFQRQKDRRGRAGRERLNHFLNCKEVSPHDVPV